MNELLENLRDIVSGDRRRRKQEERRKKGYQNLNEVKEES